MTTIRTAAAMLTFVALATACGEAATEPTSDDASEPATSETTTVPSDAPITEWEGSTIPDGTYTKTSTMQDARRIGLSRAQALEFLGEDGEINVELVLQGETFAQIADDDNETMVQGDGGSLAYDAEGNLVMTSTASGCYGCTATWAWKHRGDTLTLELLDTTESGDPSAVLVGRLIFEGTFARR